MKVLSLGGCGEMGRHAVKTLLESGLCEKVIIADINASSAKSFAKECGPGAAWLQADVSDDKSLKAAISEADLVMNTVGPFFRFGERVLKACIETKRHYVDINDDWEPTLDMLGLNFKAMKAGITAIIGMGASPGVSNMLAAKAGAELDRVEELYTGWDLDSAKPERIGPRPSAATVHGIHQLTGTICAFSDGKFHQTRPIQEIILDYPGIGAFPAWTIGHPETVTMPRYYSTLRRCANVMNTTKANLLGIKAIGKLVDLKILSVERAAWIAERVEGPMDAERTPESLLQETAADPNGGLPPLFALAKGKKDGKPAAAAAMALSAPLGGMGGATGVPLAVGASLMIRGIVNAPGVFAPEGVVDPDDFFQALAPLCSPAKKGVEDMVLITRSWENTTVQDILRKM